MLSICTGIGRISLRRLSGSPVVGMELADVVNTLNKIAPLKLAEGWDNVGLLVEPSAPHTVRNIMLTNDLTIEVMNESIEANTDLIVSYHPPIFQSLKRITTKSWKEQLVVSALENRIAIYSPHTACDAVQDGVNDWLASGISEAMQVKPIKCKSQSGSGGLLCLRPTVHSSITFLQNRFGNDIQIVKNSPSGSIAFLSGTYDLCQELHKLGIPSSEVIHIPNSEQAILDTGAGRLCTLEHPITLKVIIDRLKEHLNLKHLRLALGLGKSLKSSTSTVALCAGSGSSVLSGCNADIYLTGEMSHHDVLDATQKGISVILCEHSNSERGYLHHLKTVLAAYLHGNGVDIIVSSKDRDPLDVI